MGFQRRSDASCLAFEKRSVLQEGLWDRLPTGLSAAQGLRAPHGGLSSCAFLSWRETSASPLAPAPAPGD